MLQRRSLSTAHRKHSEALIPVLRRGNLREPGGATRGRTIVVTGSNTGIGYETALALAERSAKVVLAV